jgi:glycine C-acetyltransferase
MVAQGKARIRTIMNAALTREDLDFAIGAFGQAGRDLGIIGAKNPL